MPLRQKFWDAWSFYDFKSDFEANRPHGEMPSWVPPMDQRRLQSYKMLDSYYRNAARFWLGDEVDDDERRQRREYGDPFLIVESVRSSVLGNDQNIMVDGAVDEPGGPEDEQQSKLVEWAQKERFKMKANEGERDAVKYGDCVYVMGWDAEKKRPRIRVFDPGFYFPVLGEDLKNEPDMGDLAENDSLDEDFPRKVHIAYEFKRTIGEKEHTFLRRITWTLKRQDTAIQYAWNDDPSFDACFMDDAEWDLDAEPNLPGLLDLRYESATNTFRDNVPLNIDFIPVVHIPNTIAENDHFGVSTLANVIQIFDDMSSTDTDLQAASATTGSPPIAMSGGSGDDDRTYGPGTVFDVGDGRMDMLDTSRSLDALLKYRQELGDRLSINSRTPRTLLGAVDPSKVPSGIVLTLSFSPHSRMVNEMRLVRDNGYDLIFKFVSRFYLADGQIGEIFPAHFSLGSYLPADKTEAMNIVVQGLQSHALSLETCLKILTEAGFPIDDAAKELDRIVQVDFSAANDMLNATADMDAVRERLGLPPLTADQIPTPGGGGTASPVPQQPGGAQPQDFGGQAPFAL